MNYWEVNFDGLVGPTHNYGGLARGNLASRKNAQLTSNPKAAALQGLEKMRLLIQLGYKQGFMPPQQRPNIRVLQDLGFVGSDQRIVEQVATTSPELLPLVYSASSMWTANAATVTPSLDSRDGKVHFTPANLLSCAHRAIEHTETESCLRQIFYDQEFFDVHSALPSQNFFADEGAANHTRLYAGEGKPGLSLFVYGKCSSEKGLQLPARQTLAASMAVARRHGLSEKNALFLQQSAEAINAGAFHNDVVAVGNGPVLFYHEQAFSLESQASVFKNIETNSRLGGAFNPVEVPSNRISLDDAISSYLFNSQLLTPPDGNVGRMTLIAPIECQENPGVAAYVDELVESQQNPIMKVTYVDLKQSMRNGGGPACLRLRVLLSEKELASVDPRYLLDEQKIDMLQAWVQRHYREQLSPMDLQDPNLLDESYAALDELTHLLDLGEYYSFQQ